jgi:hypothetical protein
LQEEGHKRPPRLSQSSRGQGPPSLQSGEAPEILTKTSPTLHDHGASL